MVINERRVEARHHACCCFRKIEPREKLQEEGHPRCFVRCCGGSPPQSRLDNESPLEKYPKLLLQRMLLYTPVKCLTILVFIVYLILSVYGAVHVEQGLVLSNLVDKTSYYYSYSTTDEKYFRTEMIVSFIVDSDQIDYRDAGIQNKILTMMETLHNDSFVGKDFQWNWLKEFIESDLYTGKHEDFIPGLAVYLMHRPELQNDVIFDDEGNITTSKFHILTKNLKDSSGQAAMMVRMREIADNSGLPVFAYTPPFIFFEQYVSVLPSTLKTVGIAVIVMIIVTAIFMPHPMLVFLVGVTMIMILLGIFGFMYYWDLTLSSVTMIHLIMSIGFSVDFSAHICHAYICVEGVTRNAVVNAALTRAGGPVFNAAISTILGIIVLVFSTSYIFMSFFKLMLLVMLFGFAHAMFLLPVVLSIIGPTVNIVDLPKQADPKLRAKLSIASALDNLEFNKDREEIDISRTDSDTKKEPISVENEAFQEDNGTSSYT